MGSPIFAPQSKNPILSVFLSLSFLFLLSFFLICKHSYTFNSLSSAPADHLRNSHETGNNCTAVHSFADYGSKCAYVKSHGSCSSDGYLNYLQIFYCDCTNSPVLGYAVLLLWLLVLFYVLGNTTAEYFCPSVEYLSKVLKLSPTIAGTTLLPLGNGANDVFSSVISFTRSGAGDVGLSSILGGALFVSCFVVGIVSISVSSRRITVDESSFIRDVLFFLITLCCLLTIILLGRVHLWFAVSFVCIYFVYIGVVSAMHFFRSKEEKPIMGSSILDDIDSMATPLLSYVDEEKGIQTPNFRASNRIPHVDPACSYYTKRVVQIVELPLLLPMKITIPVIMEEKWSKPLAVCSVALAPILLATLWNTQKGDHNSKISQWIYLSASFIGLILANLAVFSTKRSSPPSSFALPWLAGGFLMSITWTYIIVRELVSLLVALANILGISPSILGLTVLAWGNSVGDLVSNLAMALKGGADGAQVAMSGCYAGPLFNTLVGLGMSMVVAAWEEYPSSYTVPCNDDLYETMGFLMGGLLWGLVILPKRKMELDRWLGAGLLAIYSSFLCLRLAKCVGLFKFGGSF